MNCEICIKEKNCKIDKEKQGNNCMFFTSSATPKCERCVRKNIPICSFCTPFNNYALWEEAE